jgi:DNA-binding PadR family transcriptional regulator
VPREDATARPTDLEAAVLAVVWRDGSCTAYAIRQHFRQSPTPRWSGSAGAIYPLVHRLEARRWLRSTPGKVGARNQRDRELTAEGRAALRGWLSDPSEADTALLHDPLRTKVLFLAALSPKEGREFVAKALEALHRQLATARADCRREAAGGSRDSRLAARNALLLTRARVAWLIEVQKELV